ncbi:hypothetical protein C9374_010489 [Naegleria lovaniensis]|uniref:Uncharacterized protein n=1 Tax=Naegleria lovaniensis TaxID=51637 RepID=A0AA88GBQ4_NAELO|nr:uncharacterized protein C9374_010489 [Naegleria lovaniensis]KAG2374745.1 hypothetical protein C9374_010489 [Naegleria lovaniensis]
MTPPIVFDVSEDEEDVVLNATPIRPIRSNSNSFSKSNPSTQQSKRPKDQLYDSFESSEEIDDKPQRKKTKKKENTVPTIQKSLLSYRKKKEQGIASSSPPRCTISMISDSETDDDHGTASNNNVHSNSQNSSSAIVISSDEEASKDLQAILHYKQTNHSSKKLKKTTSAKPSKQQRDDSSEDEHIVFGSNITEKIKKKKRIIERDLEDFIVDDDAEDSQSTNQIEEEEEAVIQVHTDEEEIETGEETEDDEEFEETTMSQEIDLISINSDDIDVNALIEIEEATQSETTQSTAQLKSKYKRLIKNPPKLTELPNGWKTDDEGDDATYYLQNFMLEGRMYNKLYSFQKEGIKWLNQRYNDSTYRGGILADEMGLGKTVQLSSFLSGIAAAEAGKRFLVVAPLSVLQTWISELRQWAPLVTPYLFHALQKSEFEYMIKSFHSHTKKHPGVLITTYRTLVSKIGLFASICAKQEFDVTIVDEAHQIKNEKTAIATNLRKVTSKAKFCLTGTPLMNKLVEMWAIYDYIFYGNNILGNRSEFKKNYELDIVKSRRRDASNTQKILGNKLSQKLRALISTYFLKRLKSQVLESDHNVGMSSILKKQGTGKAKISQKNELVLWCYLAKAQEVLYTNYLKSETVRQILSKNTDRACILSAISALRTMCDHPRLNANADTFLSKIDDNSEEEDDDENIEKLLSQEMEEHIDVSDIPCETLIAESSKLTVMVKLLKEHKRTGHRTLIFSQYTSMLDIVEHIIRKHLKLKVLRIDGTISSTKERQSRVELFQKDPSYSCFLLTTGAGGVGLTLTGASRCIILDISWNPATDQQAVDRAYRVGQTKNVVTYRLVNVGTIEEVMYRRQVIKDGLIKNTLVKENQYRYFTSEQELLEIFTLRDKRSSETQKLLESLHPKGKIYEELESHVKDLEKLEEINGVTWHDMLYSVESDDYLNESFNYEDDAAVQKKHTISNYLKRQQEKTVVDLASDTPSSKNQHRRVSKAGSSSSHSSQVVVNLVSPPPAARIPLNPSSSMQLPQLPIFQHEFSHFNLPVDFARPAETIPMPTRTSVTLGFQPNTHFVQSHENIENMDPNTVSEVQTIK